MFLIKGSSIYLIFYIIILNINDTYSSTNTTEIIEYSLQNTTTEDDITSNNLHIKFYINLAFLIGSILGHCFDYLRNGYFVPWADRQNLVLNIFPYFISLAFGFLNFNAFSEWVSNYPSHILKYLTFLIAGFTSSQLPIAVKIKIFNYIQQQESLRANIIL